MERQIVVITQVELHGLKYGQDIITQIGRSAEAGNRALEGTKGFIDGLIENLKNGRPVTLDKLERLRDAYLPMVSTEFENIERNTQVLWRAVQDEENKAREADEIARGVNR